MRARQLEEALKVAMDDPEETRRNRQPAIEEAKVGVSAEPVQPENAFNRAWNKTRDTAMEFKEKHPDLIKAVGKSILYVAGLQVSRWVIQQFI